MDAENTLRLTLDATTNVLTAVYTPPARPDSADSALAPASPAETDGATALDTEVSVAVDDDAPRPNVNADLPSWDTLAAATVAQGWGAEALDSQAVLTFIDLCRHANETVKAPVGQVIDGSLELELDAERMSALLTLLPPKGGKPVTLEAVRQVLAERGIVHGILEQELIDAVTQGRRETTQIARGTPPTRGTPTRFESLLDRLKPRGQDIDELAQVDYRDLGSLLLVTPGMPLMRRTPPLPGVDGSTVLGEPILPNELPDTPFASDLSGAAVDPEDPLLLRATIAGTPTLVSHGVQVNPLVEVDAVNLSTGNIHFEGSLLVRGDIAATMEVHVTGDVMVNGTMEAALVEAGGNVTVKGGIIGLAEALQDATAAGGPPPPGGGGGRRRPRKKRNRRTKRQERRQLYKKKT
ncbi:DUF342 domain-containing protein, partial [Achromobacter aegrifaciens]|uniref:DUF342 domain-containing protein n=1 Tax=Achromobacter aegrifaciens TaxID=1287736 RepID=UPI001FCADD83